MATHPWPAIVLQSPAHTKVRALEEQSEDPGEGRAARVPLLRVGSVVSSEPAAHCVKVDDTLLCTGWRTTWPSPGTDLHPPIHHITALHLASCKLLLLCGQAETRRGMNSPKSNASEHCFERMARV